MSDSGAERATIVLPDRRIESLEEWCAAGGGEGLAGANDLAPEGTIAELERAGVRGRGRAGFPAATKWRTSYDARTARILTSFVMEQRARFATPTRSTPGARRPMSSSSAPGVVARVNANCRRCETAAEALAQADRSWLERLITRRVPVERWSDALTRRSDDVKPIIAFAEGN